MGFPSASVLFILNPLMLEPSVCSSEGTGVEGISLQPVETVNIQLLGLMRTFDSSVCLYVDVLLPGSFLLLIVSVGGLASCRSEMFCFSNTVLPSDTFSYIHDELVLAGYRALKRGGGTIA
jgi:hypothetical protein